ncbi:MAG: redox-regulated molecular chaperone HslO [Candidatus Rifleibacteriota bacterium]
MDQLLYGFSKEKMISLTFVDVSEAAKELERKHLSGPTAGRFLAEALVAIAIMSSDLGDNDEKLALQAQVSGPLSGCFVDVTRSGNLRGYTNTKILNDFDGTENIELAKPLGESGSLTITHSSRLGIISQHQIACNPMNLRHGLARYFNDIHQKPTAIEISATSRNHQIYHAVGLRMTRLPEGTPENFVPLLERFNDQTIKKALAQSVDIKVLSNRLGLTDLQIIEQRPLFSRCTCSHEKVLYSLSCLPEEELRDILKKKEAPEVYCHFCSQLYTIQTEEIARLILERKSESKDE